MQHTVLLVDDDPDILELFLYMLRREAYAVEVASTAVEAFGVLAAAESVSVVVADEGMPGMSGTELLARVQVEYPETVRVMVTGQASVEVAKRAINEGHVFGFLTKPVSTADLVSTLRDAVSIWLARSTPAVVDRSSSRRRSEMVQLESEWQGLTQVKRDASGAIVMDEAGGDLDDVLREMGEHRTQAPSPRGRRGPTP